MTKPADSLMDLTTDYSNQIDKIWETEGQDSPSVEQIKAMIMSLAYMSAKACLMYCTKNDVTATEMRRRFFEAFDKSAETIVESLAEDMESSKKSSVH